MIDGGVGAGRAPYRVCWGVIAAVVAAAALLVGCAGGPSASAPKAQADLGVLVMAHGGGDAWNSGVKEVLAPLGEDYPMEIAFGMADAATLQEGVSALEARGARRIVVVRLFISGESFLDRTQKILGLLPGAPAKPAMADHPHKDDGKMHMAFWRIDTRASFALSKEGLSDAPEMDAVLVERAQDLSRDPEHESVLILAHGPGDDAENARWLAKINARAEALRAALPFREVRFETLREDWPEKREAAEKRIRGFVEAGSRDGGRVIVIPYRVQGFGPYAKVLDGLDYAADGQGLAPSAAVEQWARRQVEALATGPFQTPQE